MHADAHVNKLDRAFHVGGFYGGLVRICSRNATRSDRWLPWACLLEMSAQYSQGGEQCKSARHEPDRHSFERIA